MHLFCPVEGMGLTLHFGPLPSVRKPLFVLPDPTGFARLVDLMEILLCIVAAQPSDPQLFHYHICIADCRRARGLGTQSPANEYRIVESGNEDNDADRLSLSFAGYCYTFYSLVADHLPVQV